jgi:nucleoside-diphosphate-sugar epimerase
LKVMVLGGTGFLGPFVVDELLRRSHEVAVVGRREREFSRPVKHFSGDASEAAQLRRVTKAWRPEGVVDLLHDTAAQAQAVVRALGGKVERSVHVSCAEVYGSRPVCPVDEESEVLSAQDVEGAAQQAAADEIVLGAAANGKLPAAVVRLPALYGPRAPRPAEWFFVRRILDGRQRLALPDGGLHICHRGFVQNMAWGVAQALTAAKAPGQVYNLGEEKLYTLSQLAQGIAKALDHEWELYSVPGHLWTTPHAHTSFFDLRKARSHLRYRDRMIPRDGLEITVAHLCQQPMGDEWSWPGIDDPFDYHREDALIETHGARIEP